MPACLGKAPPQTAGAIGVSDSRKHVRQIKSKIESLGLTYSEIAERTGISSGQISRFLNEKRDISSSSYVSLCESLGLEAAVDDTVVGAKSRKTQLLEDNVEKISRIRDAKISTIWSRLAGSLSPEDVEVVYALLCNKEEAAIAQDLGCSRREVQYMSRLILRRLAKTLLHELGDLK